MPIYEYRCCKCAHEFEMILRGFEKGPKIACPKMRAQ
jgi:putative FmdB family regulatory protein